MEESYSVEEVCAFVEAYCVAGKAAQESLLQKRVVGRCWMAPGSVAVRFALLAEKTVGFHKALGFGMGVGSNLVERNIQLMADMEDVVEELARRTEVVGKKEFESGLEQELGAG